MGLSSLIIMPLSICDSNRTMYKVDFTYPVLDGYMKKIIIYNLVDNAKFGTCEEVTKRQL